jgi:hypothetical protein
MTPTEANQSNSVWVISFLWAAINLSLRWSYRISSFFRQLCNKMKLECTAKVSTANANLKVIRDQAGDFISSLGGGKHGHRVSQAVVTSAMAVKVYLVKEGQLKASHWQCSVQTMGIVANGFSWAYDSTVSDKLQTKPFTSEWLRSALSLVVK